MTDYLHALPPGYRLEEYELVRVLGSGGFGITYLGYDHHLDKAVAIKEYLPNDLAVRTDNNSVLPKSSQDQADYEWGLERFLSEAQTLARFDHRHIIKIHRFFRAHGTGYSVMEYAEGETLLEVLHRKGTLTEAELKAILFPILDGLEAVHEADFLHRDIKPSNIVIRDDGSPVLIDFGSARQAVAGKSRSVTAIVTPGYAPIEQYSVNGHQGPWTDIYALGAVCYRCLAGEPPDDATERLREDPLIPAIQRCEGKAGAALLNAIDRALRVDEGERPQSIKEWREALVGDGKSGERVTGSAHGSVTQSAEGTAIPRTGMSWSSMALVLVIVGLLGVSAWQGWHLYRVASGDGTGETIAVVGQPTDTRAGSPADVALDTQVGNDVEAALETADIGARQPAETASGIDTDKPTETLWNVTHLMEGWDAFEKGDYLEAMRWFRMAAERGSAEAQWILGEMHASGEGVTKDHAEAARWFRKAAEQGHAKAQVRLGAMYADGMGVLQDYVAAYMWLNIVTSTATDDQVVIVKTREMRDIVAKQMAPAGILEAQRRARICLESNYQECD